MILTRQSRVLIRILGQLTRHRITPTTSTIFKYHKLNSNCVTRNFSSVFSKSPEYSDEPIIDLATFEPICEETLESLTDYFEEIIDADEKLSTADVSYSVSEMKFSKLLYRY